MKVVAATLLNQPNRSARDYRGITSEYQAKLFQDDHDVRPYYAACYLNYKLDFLWRNQKLDASFKIYRYYLMSTIGNKIGGRGDIFGRSRADQGLISDRIIQLCDDEIKLKAFLIAVYDTLERRVNSMAIQGRERLRDTIRSETFAKAFDGDVSTLQLNLG